MLLKVPPALQVGEGELSVAATELHFPESLAYEMTLFMRLSCAALGKMADGMNVGVNLEAFSQAINAIQALRSSVTRVFDSLKDGMKNKETLEGREKVFITEFQDNLQSVNRDLK